MFTLYFFPCWEREKAKFFVKFFSSIFNWRGWSPEIVFVFCVHCFKHVKWKLYVSQIEYLAYILQKAFLVIWRSSFLLKLILCKYKSVAGGTN
jgi:branched-subunit amino acid transport protein AzlD